MHGFKLQYNFTKTLLRKFQILFSITNTHQEIKSKHDNQLIY